MNKTALCLLPLLLLFSCATLPRAERSVYNTLRESIVNNDFPTMERIFAGTDKGVIQRVINTQDRQGNTLLLLVASSARVNMTEALLKNGADPNIAGQNKQTPLHIAVSSQYKGIVELLLRHNAGKNTKDNKGKTPLDYAFETKNSDLVAMLNNSAAPSRQPGAYSTAGKPVAGGTAAQAEFLAALESNDADAVRRLLESGRVDMYQDVPAAGSRRAMPILLWAIDSNRSLSIITEIVDYYTESLDELVDRDGRNAWYYAMLRNNRAVQELLRKKNIDTKNAANTQW